MTTKTRYRNHLLLLIFLFSSADVFCSPPPCGAQFGSIAKYAGEQLDEKILGDSKRLRYLDRVLSKLRTDAVPHEPSDPGVKVVIAAIELGHIKGLKNSEGSALNIKAGGVSVVMDDIARRYPELLARQKNGQLVFVSLIMDNMSKEGLKHLRDVQALVAGHHWNLGVHEYLSPWGAKYIFLDHPAFHRFNALPKKQGESVYTMRGLEAENGWPEDVFEKQKIWSAFNQGIAEIFAHEKGDIYFPQDSHAAPASFYIRNHHELWPISTKPLVHNEGYVGNFHLEGDEREKARAAWNLTPQEMNEFFMQGNQLVMLAPAIRLAERHELISALSVADGTADSINLHPEMQKIDFFKRVEGLTNGLDDENRPHLNKALKPAQEKDLNQDGIHDPEVIAQFQKKGFRYGFPNQKGEQILKAKGDAKTAIQKNFGMALDPSKPLFISFARMVHQKGMAFTAANIEHILEKGGQVVVGGPVGDDIGGHERQMFLDIKKKLEREHNPNARNFVFVDGFVKGHLKGLLLAGSDFFIIPSRYEPCGLTDVEALYMGSIPIVHNVGGLGKGKNSILYGPTNPDDQGWELGEAINRAFSLFGERSSFGKRQLAAMKEDFSWEKNFEKFIQVNRMETYRGMMDELEKNIALGHLSEDEAVAFLHKKIFIENPEDAPELLRLIGKLHPTRRSHLMNRVTGT